ncbi:MAG: nucleoside triphosphate pyrophosphohydrolase [Gracilibacteraceae bacterium]|jgi:tetrapyrrole methylase family protein/MazG family protein|nr:nucleoside triphosphate pyrophosphohydrolase [Gracilibacteraceae bacterium]
MQKITIVGLGPGDYKQLSLEALEIIKNAETLVLRTEKHPVADRIRELGISYTCCDDIYNSCESFEETYKRISQRILNLCREKGQVVYAVPGHPLVAEKSVELITAGAGADIQVSIVPALSFIDVILSSLKIDPVYGLKIIDGLSIKTQKPDKKCGNIITQVYDRLTASEVKLMLMDYYTDDFDIYIIRAAGVEGQERVESIPLYELDRIDWMDYLTSIYIPPALEKGGKYKSFEELVEIMEDLRGEKGCPWDKKQTRESLKPYLLEETYEVLDAIEKDDLELIVEELGDLLLQVVFHSQIAKEDGEFDINEVITGIVNKLVIRHPHVFGDIKATSESGALKSWEASKRRYKGIDTYTKTLEDIPEILPALMRAYKVQQKAALAGFDWDEFEEAFSKVYEEAEEVKEVYKTGEKAIIEEEIGDLLFSVVNVSRFLKVQPELALRATTEKFIKRFKYIEETALQSGKKLVKMSLQEMDKLWNEAKQQVLAKKDEKK